jgi:hypothetical protein
MFWFYVIPHEVKKVFGRPLIEVSVYKHIRLQILQYAENFSLYVLLQTDNRSCSVGLRKLQPSAVEFLAVTLTVMIY